MGHTVHTDSMADDFITPSAYSRSSKLSANVSLTALPVTWAPWRSRVDLTTVTTDLNGISSQQLNEGSIGSPTSSSDYTTPIYSGTTPTSGSSFDYEDQALNRYMLPDPARLVTLMIQNEKSVRLANVMPKVAEPHSHSEMVLDSRSRLSVSRLSVCRNVSLASRSDLQMQSKASVGSRLHLVVRTCRPTLYTSLSVIQNASHF